MRPASEAAQGETDALFEDFEVGRALAREGVLFHPSPQALVGIQFRGIGGQTIHPQAGGVFLDRRPRFFRARGVQPIPEQEDHAGNPAPQVADEGDDLGAGDRAPYQTEIGVRVGRDRRDGRELGPVEAVVEKRRLASRSPGLAGGGQQGEAALVEEDQRSLQDLGFFSSPARGVSPNAGWRPGRVRERGGPASASSSRSGAAGGQHDRDHSAPGSGAQSDPPLAAWSRSAKRIRKPRPPARAGAEAARVERGPVSSGVRGVGGGVQARLTVPLPLLGPDKHRLAAHAELPGNRSERISALEERSRSQSPRLHRARVSSGTYGDVGHKPTVPLNMHLSMYLCRGL